MSIRHSVWQIFMLVKIGILYFLAGTQNTDVTTETTKQETETTSM